MSCKPNIQKVKHYHMTMEGCILSYKLFSVQIKSPRYYVCVVCVCVVCDSANKIKERLVVFSWGSKLVPWYFLRFYHISKHLTGNPKFNSTIWQVEPARTFLLLSGFEQVTKDMFIYYRILKVTGPITFGISSPKGPQLLGSSYFQVAVTFGQLKYASNPFQETH